MKSFKTRIAAGATILGLGGLTGLALSAGHQKAPQPVATKPLVRTKVIRRTIHVIKHVKPKHPVGASPVAAGRTGTAFGGAAGGTSGAHVATGSSSVGSVPSASHSAPVVTHTSGAAAGSHGSHSAPVVTHTSGGGGGGKGGAVVTHASGGGEHEGGDHGD